MCCVRVGTEEDAQATPGSVQMQTSHGTWMTLAQTEITVTAIGPLDEGLL